MIRVDVVAPVAIVAINRPERRNAVDGPTARALVEALRAADADPTVRVIVITGAEGTFCAGADLHAVAAGEQMPRLDPAGDGPMGPTRLVTRCPVVAAIEGFAVAGGLELALWADLRVCASDAVLGVFCRRVGVPLIDGGTARLPRLVGLGRALDLILTGRPVDAAEALSWGLVDRVSPPGQALATAVELARTIAGFPQACLRADLASARAAFDAPLPEALAAEFVRGVAVLPDAQAGARRFAAGAGRHGTSMGGNDG